MAKKRGEDSASDKLLLKRAVKKRIDYLKRKPRLTTAEAYNLVKGFFKALLGVDYEFTREELLEELDRVYLEEALKERVTHVILQLGKVEFAPTDYSQHDLRGMLDVFGETVDHMVHSEIIKLGFWDKIAHFFKLLAKHDAEKRAKKAKSKGTEDLTPLQSFLSEADLNLDEQFETGAEDISEEVVDMKAPKHHEKKKEQDIVVDIPTETIPAESSSFPMEADPGSPGPKPGHPGFLNDFNTMLEEFYYNLETKKIHAAKLNYEEMKHTYDYMEAEEKRKVYEKLVQAFEDISTIQHMK